MRYTLASFKAAEDWVAQLNMDPSDPRWLILLNKALERLMNSGLYVGTYQRYRICACSACITWPRQFDTIEVIDVCDRPMVIRNQWFEFLENGPGLARLKSCISHNVFDRGRGFVMFDDLRVASRLRFYTQFASDAGKVINVRGYDNSGNWVLTSNGATVGENVTLTSTFVDTVTTWMPQVFREAIKPKTAGYVRAFGWQAGLPVPPLSPGPADTPLQPLAAWEPSETLPNYRRSFIPALSSATGASCGCDSNSPPSACRNQSATVMARMAFVPIESDLDFIPLTCAPAISMAMLSIQRAQRGDVAGAKAAMYGTWDEIRKRYVDGAIPMLEDELDTFQGQGTVVPVRIESSRTGTAYVTNLI